MRYKTWRSHADPDKCLHVLIVADPPEGPETNWAKHVPEMVRRLGPWVGGPGGEVKRLKPLYRDVLDAHGFMVINCRPTLLDLELPARRRLRRVP